MPAVAVHFVRWAMAQMLSTSRGSARLRVRVSRALARAGLTT